MVANIIVVFLLAVIFRPGEDSIRLDPTPDSQGTCGLNDNLGSTKEEIRQYLQRKFP